MERVHALDRNGGRAAAARRCVRAHFSAIWSCSLTHPLPCTSELGINFDHILQKSLTVLNPLRSVDPHIMDDADLAGPLVFCFVFASFLLLVSVLEADCLLLKLDTPNLQSGKPQFSYIYGVALIGSVSMYALLNLMSESGIDAYRTASVLGYCILPLVLLSMLSVVLSLECVACVIRSR